VGTAPPVFFGNNGLLPVLDDPVPPFGSKSSLGTSFNLYVTHNGGQTWTPTKLVTGNPSSNGLSISFPYIVDSQHAWAALNSSFFATNNGGQSWTQLPSTQQLILSLNFIDPNNGWAIGSSSVHYIVDNTKNQPPPPSLLHTIDGGHTWQPINYFIDGKPITTSLTGGGSTSPTPVIKSKI